MLQAYKWNIEMDTRVACTLLNASENQGDFVLFPSYITEFSFKAVSELEPSSFETDFCYPQTSFRCSCASLLMNSYTGHDKCQSFSV